MITAKEARNQFLPPKSFMAHYLEVLSQIIINATRNGYTMTYMDDFGRMTPDIQQEVLNKLDDAGYRHSLKHNILTIRWDLPGDIVPSP